MSNYLDGDSIDGLLGTDATNPSSHTTGNASTSTNPNTRPTTNSTGDDDIQVISRDDYPDQFDHQFTPNLPTPSLSHNQLFHEDFDPHHTTGHTPLFPTHKEDSPQAQETYNNNYAGQPGHSGLTPVLAPVNDHNQNVQGHSQSLAPTHSNNFSLIPTSSALPPLPALSESVIPSGFTMQAFSSLGDDQKGSTSSAGALTTTSSKRKKESSAPKTRPAFVMKIWSMVNDESNKEYIRWNDDGQTFQVFHREEFMKVILPKYFKHNNFASFVRQLNMYGWHKVQDISSGTLNQGKDEKSSDEIWQFKNPNFVRDREDLLDKIVRNKAVTQADAEGTEPGQINFQVLLNELDQIKLHQLAITEDLRRVRKDNKTLWQENYNTRERHQNQARTLDKILNFLATLYGNNAGKIMELDNAGFDAGQMTAYNQPVPASPGYAPQPNTNNNVAPGGPMPFQRPRLMLTDQAHKRSPQQENTKSPRAPPTHRGSSTTDSGTIEEIIRSYGNTPNNYPNGNANAEAPANVNKIYQQLINLDPGVSSPRHFFPELNTNPSSPYVGPSTPGQARPQSGSENNPADLMTGLEQNIYKQGQSIQQVQDWIQKLASQQQQQQATINEINDDLKPELDEFDVNEFLNNSSSKGPVKEEETYSAPVREAGPGLRTTDRNSGAPNNNGGNGSKRSIEELYGSWIDDGHAAKKKN